MAQLLITALFLFVILFHVHAQNVAEQLRSCYHSESGCEATNALGCSKRFATR